MSTLRVNAIQNSTGGDLITAKGMARAWVNFNGQGTVAIRSAHNVSSVTDLGSGRQRVNFETAMPDADYATVTGLFEFDTSSTNQSIKVSAPLTTSVSFDTVQGNSGSLADFSGVYVAVFR